MLIFKQLEHAIKSVTREKKQTNDTKKLALIDEKLNALFEISEYIKAGEWLGKTSAIDRMRYSLKHTIAETAEKFECSKDSVSSSLTKYSRKLEGLIGSNTISMIVEGKVREGLVQFYLKSGAFSVEQIIASDVHSYLPDQAELEDCSIAECLNELKVLRICSSAYIKNLFKRVSLEKVAFLLYILNSEDSKYADIRREMYMFLTSKEGDIDAFKRFLVDGDLYVGDGNA